MVNILSIDLEEWYHANYDDNLFDNGLTYENRVVRNTNRMLEMFDACGAKATFFTLGVIAEQYPELVRAIHDRGHEIATHGYGHQLVYKQDASAFEEDLLKSVSLIDQAVGVKPIGYRAPSWSVTKDTTWVYPILRRHGIRYDASVFPIRTYLYGFPEAPRDPFAVELDDGSEILEFPTSTLRLAGRSLPFSGGFYFRFLPYPFIRAAFRRLNRQGRPGMFYLHPREIDPGQPRLEGLNRRDRFIHEYGLRGGERKLAKLLRDFAFTSARDYFDGGDTAAALPRIPLGALGTAEAEAVMAGGHTPRP